MKIRELFEGGWETTATQSTVITPAITKVALGVMKNQFIPDLNKFLATQGIEPIEMGHPTGSSAHYQKDPEDVIYGDIDLQIIVPFIEGKNTTGERQSFWSSKIVQFIKQHGDVPYLHPDNAAMIARKDGNGPVIKVGPEQYIQIDIMPHTKELSQWGRYRATAERGLKGLLNGNIFAILSSMFDVNLQHSGLQYKAVDGKKVNYAKTRKGYELTTVGTNINTFVYDLFKHEVELIRPKHVVVDPLLKSNQGVQKVNDPEELRVLTLVNSVKGLARSFDASGMFGQGELENYSNAQHFIDTFVHLYMEKAQYAIDNKKRDKAVTQQAIDRAKSDRDNIAKGAEYVKYLFQNDNATLSYSEYINKKAEMNEDISRDQLLRIEHFADRLFKSFGIDVEFTYHFLDRVNDPRNKTPISAEDLVFLFKKEYEQHGRQIARLDKNAEAVMKDLITDLNLPFIINRSNNGKKLVAKTVMRKKNFTTPNQTFQVQ